MTLRAKSCSPSARATIRASRFSGMFKKYGSRRAQQLREAARGGQDAHTESPGWLSDLRSPFWAVGGPWQQGMYQAACSRKAHSSSGDKRFCTRGGHSCTTRSQPRDGHLRAVRAAAAAAVPGYGADAMITAAAACRPAACC